MTFVLASSKLTYDHLGDWVGVSDKVSAQAPFGYIGDSSVPGNCTPGTFTPGEEIQEAFLKIEVI